MHKKWLTTEDPNIIFEADNAVGRLKKEIWDASEEEIDKILEEYGIPSPSELGVAGTYIQNCLLYTSAIQANHSKMVMEDARTGELDKNPVRWDIEEAISLMPIDFILNVVLDENKRIIKAVAGHFIEAHREGCRFLDGIYKKPIKELADIVIVSPGGYPKDINMYQAQKALDNAKHAVKDGGVIIWVASCTEGFGEGVFEEWINEAESPHSLVERIQRQFQLGGHKAAAIAMVLERCDVFLVSDLDERIVRKAFLTPYLSLIHI